MSVSGFYILSWRHLVFVNAKVYVAKILFDIKFFPKL